MLEQEHHSSQEVLRSSSPSPHSSGGSFIATSFDELAKGLANGTLSRGKAIRLVGGAVLGAALASVPGVAWADDDRCSEGQTRCGDRCVNLLTNERHCGSCSNRCRSTQTCCKGRCVNLQKNERHCGSCSNRCPEGSECVSGECLVQSACPSGCGGTPECGSGGQFSCFCLTTAEQTCACVESASCEGLLTCNTSDDCPQGTLCILGCQSGKVCQPLCSTP